MKKAEKQILAEIKKAKKILMHLHLGPDGDSIGSVFTIWRWLEKLGKKATVVSFDPIPEEFGFLEEAKRVKRGDVAKMDLSKFDLWLSLDSADWNMITKKDDFQSSENLMLINIDHHPTNTGFGKINYVFRGDPATASILFELFQKWQVKIDKKMATCLYLGIYEDTGSFRFDYTKPETLRIGARLLELGADRRLIVNSLERNRSLEVLHYWSLILGKMMINRKYRFAISKVSYEDSDRRGLTEVKNTGASTLFAPIVKGTRFGVILREGQLGEVEGSLRAKKDFDVSRIAQVMGGGGHKAAAGFRMKGDLKSVEKKLMEVIRQLNKQ